MRKSLIIALVALVASIVVPAAHADPSAIERIIAQETAKHLDPKSPYNPQGYVPGGATRRSPRRSSRRRPRSRTTRRAMCGEERR